MNLEQYINRIEDIFWSNREQMQMECLLREQLKKLETEAYLNGYNDASNKAIEEIKNISNEN